MPFYCFTNYKLGRGTVHYKLILRSNGDGKWDATVIRNKCLHILQEIEETRNRRHELLTDLLDLFYPAPNTVSSTVILIDVTNLPSTLYTLSRDYSYT
jgi:hypothetical protein